MQQNIWSARLTELKGQLGYSPVYPRITYEKKHFLDKMHRRWSHQLCRHGYWSLGWTVRLSLRTRISSKINKEAPTVKLATCASTPFFTCYHTRTHFTSQGQCLSRAARHSSLCMDYKHTQVARMDYLSSDGHGGAGCLKGVCNTHMASLLLALSVSDGYFNLHSAGWCGGN